MTVTLGEALEMARSAGMIGDDLRCQALVNAGEYEAADVGDLVETAGPAEGLRGVPDTRLDVLRGPDRGHVIAQSV